jgi:hypothetical protein
VHLLGVLTELTPSCTYFDVGKSESDLLREGARSAQASIASLSAIGVG